MKSDYQLLEKLSSIHAPAGDEGQLTDYLLEYVELNSNSWKCKPEVISGEGFQNNVILVFGTPRVAVFSHIDSIGFTVRYQNQLVSIGSPELSKGHPLRGSDSLGPIECTLNVDEDHRAFYEFGRSIITGTNLVWNSKFKEDEETVEGPYMDNRLGVYSMLKLAETLENGIIVFSTWEEHGGGSVPYLLRYIVERYAITSTLVCDITWITEGVVPGRGVVISMRDRNIPRRIYLERIIALAEKSGIPFQLEVEGGGSSDGREIQESPYPLDWLFVGAAEENVHSPHERVNKKDIESMIGMYQYLMEHLNSFSAISDANIKIHNTFVLGKNRLRMLNIVLFGPPGAGKGTQSEGLMKKYGLSHLSTGDLFRKNISEGTELGRKAKSFMDHGNLVPDEVVTGMVEQKIRESADVNGFIFDGYPRTKNQAKALDELMSRLGHPISIMISLEVPDDELKNRLKLRAATSGRVDDQDESKIDNRIRVYYNETRPVIEYYDEQDKHASVMGVGTIEEIFESICREVDQYTVDHH